MLIFLNLKSFPSYLFCISIQPQHTVIGVMKQFKECHKEKRMGLYVHQPGHWRQNLGSKKYSKTNSEKRLTFTKVARYRLMDPDCPMSFPLSPPTSNMGS